MSLKVCPNCKSAISGLRVYNKINAKTYRKKHLLKCKNCKAKLFLKWKKKKDTYLTIFLRGLFWMAIPLVLIYMVAACNLHFLTAILLVTIYHFAAMWYIINFYHYDKCKK